MTLTLRTLLDLIDIWNQDCRHEGTADGPVQRQLRTLITSDDPSEDDFSEAGLDVCETIVKSLEWEADAELMRDCEALKVRIRELRKAVTA